MEHKIFFLGQPSVIQIYQCLISVHIEIERIILLEKGVGRETSQPSYN